jgi:hypothetical protein
MSKPRLEILCRSAVAEKFVRPHGVVGFLPLPWFTIRRRHIQRAIRQLAKLFGVGPLGALDGALQLRGARRQDEQVTPQDLIGPLGCPSRQPPVMGTMRSALQGVQVGGSRRRHQPERKSSNTEHIRACKARRLASLSLSHNEYYRDPDPLFRRCDFVMRR